MILDIYNAILQLCGDAPLNSQFINFHDKWEPIFKKASPGRDAEASMFREFLDIIWSQMEIGKAQHPGESEGYTYNLRVGNFEYRYGSIRTEKSRKHTTRLLWGEKEIQADSFIKNNTKQFLDSWSKAANSRYESTAALLLFSLVLLNADILDENPVKYDTFEQAKHSWIELSDALINSNVQHPNKVKRLYKDKDCFTIEAEALVSDEYAISQWPLAFQTDHVENAFQTLAQSTKQSDIDKMQQEYLKIAEEVIRKADQYPLLPDMIRITSANDKQRILSIKKILQAVSTVYVSQVNRHFSYEVTIKPIVGATLSLFEEKFPPKKLRNSLYTQMDIKLFLSEAADILTQQSRYRMPQFDFINQFTQTQKNIFFSIINDPQNGFLEVIHDGTQNVVQFRYKQSRLVFLGINDALRRPTNMSISVEDLFSRINEGSFEQPAGHVGTRYNNLAVFTTAYLMSLSMSERNILLDDLCMVALTPDVTERQRQKQSIGTLTYFLYEGSHLLTGEKRLDIFRAAYGQNLYAIQESMWNYLLKNRVFSDEVAKYYNATHSLCDATLSEHSMPFYFFLWWSIPILPTIDSAKRTLLEACKQQHNTWYGHNLDAVWVADIIQQIQTIVNEIEERRNQGKSPMIYSVYTLHALLYSLANLQVMANEDHESAVLAKQAKNYLRTYAKNLQKACIYADYYMRLIADNYSKQFGNMQIYRLSGGIRFIAAYRPEWANRLSFCDMALDYQGWYANESSKRWKWLLVRLLGSCTDCKFAQFPSEEIESLDNSIIVLPPEEDYNPKDFLVYDHMPNTYNEFITQFGINPEKNSTDSRKK